MTDPYQQSQQSPEHQQYSEREQPPGQPPEHLRAIATAIERTNDLLTRVLAEVATTPSTHAIFVDAGYVYAAAGRLVAGTEDRRSFDLDAEGLIEAFIDKARTIFPDSRLLRVYWYDGARRRIHTTEQQRIAELPDVKVRLGNLNANNQQKGVDSLIRTDLESLARHRAISDAALIGGDEDLVSAVEAAQGYGARVHLWGIEAAGGRNQAEPLLWEVDSQRTFDLDFCKPYVTRRTVHEAHADGALAGRPAPGRDDVRFVGAQVAAQWLASRGRDTVAELLPGHPILPGAVDQELLVEAEALLGLSLRGHADLRRALRDGFWDHLHTQL
ncbi:MULTISPECIES: NYN domain-containing protein [Streptomyces]|uniref:NYN domain-containing protein n=1 Tax=Streptomyces nondiastaticus TaxID=3154512 RepID=A0ABW6U6G6_9ACTN|nr:NYN domain-containing protein [Streptomyces sp. VNUA116]WKU46870.1 NYN domain-containing protein [Streptomyces sp. VNUA116]